MADSRPDEDGQNHQDGQDTVRLAACRSCSDRFTHVSPTGAAVDIVTGVPAPGLTYKAISHVWGPPCTVHMVCQKCSTKHGIRIRSRATFDNIMTLAGPGGTIWMDNMSINQKDSADIAAQVSVMGEIYSGAERVSVLLPESDKEAFDVLADLLSMATTLLSRKGQFDRTQAVEQWPANGPGSFTDTGMIAKRFFTVMDDFQTKLREYQYWMRAWTFQEWATAHDIEVGLDIPGEERRPVLQKVKSTIVYVAIMITDYKLRQGQYARMDIGLTRGLAKPKLDQIKRLFPFENAFASPNEIPDAEIRFQTLMPNAGTSALLGLRSNPGQPRTAEEQFSARLRLMLDSFTGMHRRKATFEADMVCCWASMCNIAYHYSKDDSLPVALAKVTRALRQRGVKLYNFTSNGQPEQDIDLAFFAYSAAHEQVNAINMAPFPDAPIFSGRADTVKHFVTSLAACHKRHANIPHAASGDVPVQAVAGAVVALATSLSDLPSLLKAFSSATSGGDGDGMMFTSLMPLLVAALARLSAQMIETSAFILAAVPVRRGDRREYLRLWAVCPSWVVVEEGDLYVAREGLNGTLVLVKESTRRSIVAYLTVTDTRCGTFLAPVSEHGRLEILLRAPIRSDILSSGDQADRRLSATLELVDPSVVASDRCGRELLWQSFGDMAAYAAASSPGNERLPEVIARPELSPANMSRQLLERLGEPDEINWRAVLAPAQIDIGHPELIAGGSDAAKQTTVIDANQGSKADDTGRTRRQRFLDKFKLEKGHSKS